MAKVATKREMHESWTLGDVADANEAIDIDLELKEFARKQNEGK